MKSKVGRGRRWIEVLALVSVSALGSLLACRPSHEPLIAALEVAGCRDLRAGPICDIEGPTKLTIWVKAPFDAKLRLRTDAGPVPIEFAPYEDGWRIQWVATATAGALIVEARRKGLDQRRWPIELHPRTPGLLEADALAAAGKNDEAEAQWKALSDSQDPRESAEALRMIGRAHMMRGEIDSARDAWLRSAEVAGKAGLGSRANNERMSVAQVVMEGDRDVGLARVQLLKVREEMTPVDAPGTVNLKYCEATLATHVGDFETAAADFGQVASKARRLSMPKTVWGAIQARSDLLAELGRPSDAWIALNGLRMDEQTVTHPCLAGLLYDNLTWSAIRSLELGEAVHPGLQDDAERAKTLHRADCPNPEKLANAVLNLAHLTLLQGAPGEAVEQLKNARALGAEKVPARQLWLWDLEGRTALATGSPSIALERYRQMALAAARVGTPGARWRALVGKAGALAQLGLSEEALASYREAKAILRSESLAVSLSGGRSHFLAARRSASEAEVQLLLDLGRNEDALRVVRQDRAESWRGLKSALQRAQLTAPVRRQWDQAVERYRAATARLEVAAADQWGNAEVRGAAREVETQALLAERAASLDQALGLLGAEGADEVAPWSIGDRELVLLYAPLPGGRWVGMAASAAGLSVRILPDLPDPADPRAVGRGLLAPFDAELADSQSVRFLVEGVLSGFDLHAAEWRGDPLLVSHRVRYSVDAGVSRRPTSDGSTLIVGDPLGDLPASRDEAISLAQRLSAGQATTLLVGAQATRSSVVAALGRAGRFHFSGHGQADHASGLESRLRLADGTELSAADILTLPQLPGSVVLASCETARTTALAGQQLGLAQAFAFAGGAQVVAATRPVDDRLARRVSEALYGPPAPELESALQAVLVAVLKDSPGADWSAFRLVAP